MPRLDCVIEPHMVTDVSSKVDGVVDVITVDRSDLVKKDQVLVQLDARVEQAAVAYALKRAQSDAEVRANQASAEFSKRRNERVQTLFKSAALSEDQMDETETQKRLAKLELDRARETWNWPGLISFAHRRTWRNARLPVRARAASSNVIHPPSHCDRTNLDWVRQKSNEH